MSRLVPPVSERDHVLGNDRARVEVVEYGDYECPYCAQAHLVVQSLFGCLGPDLRFAFRNFPLVDLHPHALGAAVLAEAAGFQGRFWQMHDTLFEGHEALEEADLLRYAVDLGLDADRLRHELPAAEARVREDMRSGVRSGVNGTPTFFVNGVRYEGTWWDVSPFARFLAEAERRVAEPA